jgi:hypothetical protein
MKKAFLLLFLVGCASGRVQTEADLKPSPEQVAEMQLVKAHVEADQEGWLARFHYYESKGYSVNLAAEQARKDQNNGVPLP